MKLPLTRLLLALSVLGGPATAGAANARRDGAIVVRGDRIHLSDLTPTAPRALAGVDVAPAPAPGAKTVVSRAAVKAALVRAGADPRLADGLPAYQPIVRSSSTVTMEELRADIIEALLPDLPVGVHVQSIAGLKELELPEGDRTIEVQLPKLRRSTVASVAVLVRGRTLRKFPVTIRLEGKAYTPQLRRDLPRGTVVSGADVELNPTELDRLPAHAATRRDHVVGRLLVKPARAGTPIQQTATREPPAIKRGRTVNLVASQRGLRISQRVVVQEDAKIGDYIRVKSTDGSRTVRARVVSPNEVRVDLGGGR